MQPSDQTNTGRPASFFRDGSLQGQKDQIIAGFFGAAPVADSTPSQMSKEALDTRLLAFAQARHSMKVARPEVFVDYICYGMATSARPCLRSPKRLGGLLSR